MTKKILSAIRNLAFSYVYIQAIVVLLIAALLLLLGKGVVSGSFLWGGAACILPNLYFAHKLFARTGAQALRQVVTSFYTGEIAKFVITIVLFWIVFKYFKANKLAVLIGYAVAQITFWFAVLFRQRAVSKL